MALVLVALPPLCLWLASLFTRRQLVTGEAVAGYFFGVVAAFLALTIAT